MSDIVTLVGELTAVRGQRDALIVEIERLRDDRDSWADQADARVKDCEGFIVEIERLRTALVANDEGSTAYQSGWHARDAEIERLRTLLRIREHLESAEVDAVEEIANKEAEIERLRMELTKVGNGSYNPALVIAEQQAEIERLRGLLREWKDRGKHDRFYTTDFEKRVREALGDD